MRRLKKPLGSSFQSVQRATGTYQPPSPDHEVGQVRHCHGDRNLHHSEEPVQASARDSGEKGRYHRGEKGLTVKIWRKRVK